MAPHECMALVQFLLVRALVARFWEKPHHGRLIAWGAALHDRFMLPHYLGADMRVVVSDLNAAGCAFDFDWLAPFFEFRFPLCGTVPCNGVTLELRHALEPWPVLGEAATAAGTARAVDASLERVQVKLSGMDSRRYALLCNRRRVPLQAAGAAGEFVAGVRFRARTFPSMLHPTIGPHAPLAFELVDLQSSRSIGGCDYHMTTPSEEKYEQLPADQVEAKARCAARFIARGAVTTAARVPAESPDPGAACTLDLRRAPGPVA